jgi:Flp pilus assembly protein TadG
MWRQLSNTRARAKPWLSGARSKASRLRGDALATTAVEFALVAPLVIAIILGAMQVAAIYLAQAELENAAEQAARIVLTNQAPAAGSAGQTSFKNTVCGLLPALFTCSGVMVDLEAQTISAGSSDALVLTPPTLTYGSDGSVTNSWTYSPGTHGQLMILRVMYQWPVVAGPLGLVLSNLANGTLLMSSTQVFQNECSRNPATGTCS